MIYSELTRKAMAIAYEAHMGQVDKAGVPYVFHPCHVADGMPDEVSSATALLHDVVEDTKWSFEKLKQEGIPEAVIRPLKLLTHQKEDSYENYIRKVAQDPVASRVKLADLAHNSDMSRLPAVTDKDRERIQKYHKAIAYLHSVSGDGRRAGQPPEARKGRELYEIGQIFKSISFD